MIITRTPYRVSFMGGGSDLPAFYSKHQGRVVSCTINKYIYITIHPSFNPNETILRYSKVEKVTRTADIEHPVIRTVLEKYNIKGVEISSTGDIPANTGLGSSSSFTVGLLSAIHGYLGNKTSKEEIAEEACSIEIMLSGGVVGKQDQYAAAVGGVNELLFDTDGSVTVMPCELSKRVKQHLEESFMLLYVSGARSAETILARHSRNLSSSNMALSLQQKMCEKVGETKVALIEGNIKTLGKHLDYGWKAKKEIADSISNQVIDSIYTNAIALGSLGGKLLGAGGGGFILAVCPKDKQQLVIDGLGLRSIHFEIDMDGTKVIYNDGERVRI